MVHRYEVTFRDRDNGNRRTLSYTVVDFCGAFIKAREHCGHHEEIITIEKEWS